MERFLNSKFRKKNRNIKNICQENKHSKALFIS